MEKRLIKRLKKKSVEDSEDLIKGKNEEERDGKIDGRICVI